MSLRGGGGGARLESKTAALHRSSKRRPDRPFVEASEQRRGRHNDTIDNAPPLPDVYLCPFPGYCFLRCSDPIKAPHDKTSFWGRMSILRKLKSRRIFTRDPNENNELSFLSRTQGTPCYTPGSHGNLESNAANRSAKVRRIFPLRIPANFAAAHETCQKICDLKRIPSIQGGPEATRKPRQWSFNKAMSFFTSSTIHRRIPTHPYAAVNEKPPKLGTDTSISDSAGIHPAAMFPGLFSFSFPTISRACGVCREKRNPNCTLWCKPEDADSNKTRIAAKVASIASRLSFLMPSDAQQKQQQTGVNRMDPLTKMLYEWPGYLFFAEASSLAARSCRIKLPATAGRSTRPAMTASVGMRIEQGNYEKGIDVFSNMGRCGADDSLPLMAVSSQRPSIDPRTIDRSPWPSMSLDKACTALR